MDESSPAAITIDARVRQTSAPPVMSRKSSFTTSSSSSSRSAQTDKGLMEIKQTPPIVPPSVLKAQLLSVLRNRLGDAAKAGSAPLRMRKFVVWNAWTRRKSPSSPAQISRASSPQSDDDLAEDSSNRHVPVSQPRRRSHSPERTTGPASSTSDDSLMQIKAGDLFLDDDADLDDLLNLSDEEEYELDHPAPRPRVSPPVIPRVSVSVNDDDDDFHSTGRPSRRSSTPEVPGSQAYIDPALLLFAAKKPDAEAVARMLAASRSPSPEAEAEDESEQSTSSFPSHRVAGGRAGSPLFAAAPAAPVAGQYSPTNVKAEDDLYAVSVPSGNGEVSAVPTESKSVSPTLRRQEMLGTNPNYEQRQDQYFPSQKSSASATIHSAEDDDPQLPPSPRLRAKALPSPQMPRSQTPRQEINAMTPAYQPESQRHHDRRRQQSVRV